MAIYTTFFVMSAATLTSAFPGWKPPLPEPETRVVTDLFGTRTVRTREPRFEPPAATSERTPTIQTLRGDYNAYLEARLPDAVAKAPHWATKGLTPLELDSLGELIDRLPATQQALFGPPPHDAVIFEIRKDVLRAISASPADVARKWAAEMSKPARTHSQTGRRVSPDWSMEDALQIVQKICALAAKSPGGTSLYLLMEP